MIISLVLIAAVALYNVHAAVLLMLMITWLPDFLMVGMFLSLFEKK